MMDELASWTDLAVVQRLLKRIQGKGRRKRIRHPPANNAAREGVDDKGHVGKAAPIRHIGQIRNPQGVRARRGEVPMNDIRRSLYSLVRPTRYHTPAAPGPFHAHRLHQSGNGAARYTDPFPVQLQPHFPYTVNLEVLSPHPLNHWP